MRRYLKLSRFAVWLFFHIVCWEFIGGRFHSRKIARRRRVARGYCSLASEIGGLFVKMGQFLSLRFDLLPPEVTEELASLQDQMPAAPLNDIVDKIEAHLGRPTDQLFAWFDPRPLACASLAQVHEARLHSGEQVVVKVLRPDTAVMFEFDLRAMGWLIFLLRLIRPIRRQVDLDQLLAEFTSVTRCELDMLLEGRNIERFASDFDDSDQVYVPRVHWDLTDSGILTMENVGFLKINNIEEIEAAGISRFEVARQLTRVFFQQIFVKNFVHADPHPGNLFIKPLPYPEGSSADRPFQIVLIDCGMAIEIPIIYQQWLREFIVGLGLRDADRIVDSYVTGGILRRELNVDRVKEMTGDLLEQHQELLLGLLPDLRQPRARIFFEEYQDLFEYGYPFIIPMELLFMYRSLGTFGSIAKNLDPDIDLSAEAAPLAMGFIWEELRDDCGQRLQAVNELAATLMEKPLRVDQLLLQANRAFHMPDQVQRLLARKPETTARAARAAQDRMARDRDILCRLERAISRLTIAVFVLGLLVIALFFYTSPGSRDMVASAWSTLRTR